MKTGRTLSELATELERQAASKKDYIGDTRRMQLEATKDGLILQGINGGMPLRDSAHTQIAAALQIPKAYYDRMTEQTPDLLAANVNTWLQRDSAKKLVRTMDGHVRAFLSSQYRPLDNLDLAIAVLPALQNAGASVESCQVTDSRLYIKAIAHQLEREPVVGDRIRAGLVVSNSEIGMGRLTVSALDYRLVCSNGMIAERAIAKTHVGRSASNLDALEEAREYFQDATRQADDRAFFLKVADATSAMFDPSRFEARITKYADASTRKLTAEPEAIIELAQRKFGLTDGEKVGVLRHFLRDNDNSVWGLANAVTRASQDLESYDRATDFERFGGDIINLPASSWKTVS